MLISKGLGGVDADVDGKMGREDELRRRERMESEGSMSRATCI